MLLSYYCEANFRLSTRGDTKLWHVLLTYLLMFLYFSGKTDPFVILRLGDQVIRSKKNSQTTVIGPPGEPIWNQVRFLII